MYVLRYGWSSMIACLIIKLFKIYYMQMVRIFNETILTHIIVKTKKVFLTQIYSQWMDSFIFTWYIWFDMYRTFPIKNIDILHYHDAKIIYIYLFIFHNLTLSY